MKTTLQILILVLLISLSTQAQEAGKKGKLMPNEVKPSIASGTSNKKNQNSRNRGQQVYNWNYNYNRGYSEVFIRIPENGFFTVTIDDQIISNGNGRFRFFDLNSGNHTLTISTGRNLIFRTRFSTFNNTRMILDYFIFEGLYILNTEQLAHQGMLNNQYGNIWNNFWNGYYTSPLDNYGWDPYYGQNPYGNNNNWNNNNQNNNNNNWNNNQNNNNWNNQNNNNNNWNNQNNFNYQNFEEFYKAVKSQTFNDTKIEIITSQSRNTRWRTEEIKRLLQLLSFEDDKLEVAKACYQNCLDKQNYFNLYSLFTFDSSVTELNRFINGSRN
jgi:Domain of unknown function (DUF4476)